MANVKKCDICGKVYDNKCVESTFEMYVRDKKNPTHDNFMRAEDFTHIDCCPSCTDRILGFVNVMKNSKY